MTGENSKIWDEVYKYFKGKSLFVWGDDPTPFFVEKIDFLKKNNVRKLLNAGCGDGRNTIAFAKKGFEILGVDNSYEAVKKSREILKEYKKVVIEKQDLYKLNFKGEFDAVICDYILVHMENPKLILQNFHNSLKEGWFLIIEFLSLDDDAFGKGENVGHNSFVNKKIFHKFYSVNEAKLLLNKFEILEIKKIDHFDEGHGNIYPRFERHKHNSIYFLARKG